ncbi:MAG: ribonuclease R [Bacillota bacterium]|nr:ribonuclease R [Bacillota bacterium]
MRLKEKILAFMDKKAYKPMLMEEIIQEIDTSKDMKAEITKVVNELEKEGKVIKTRTSRYALPHRLNLLVGEIQGSAKGFGFFLPEDKNWEDIFVSPSDLNGAIHGDKVILRPMKNATNVKKQEGKVIRIIKRGNEEIIGTFQKDKYFAFVIPDDDRISKDIFVTKENFNGANNGEKVVVKVTKWSYDRKNPEGYVSEIIGDMKDYETHIKATLKRNNIKYDFPENVIEEAKNIDVKIRDEEIKRRKDFRDYNVITIDGKDAKDLDDAVHIKKLKDNNFELGVHIADVTHYVGKKSNLRKEAYERGTSTYLADRVIPMLPKELSNGVCSLNPNEDKLTLSAVMTVDRNGNVINHEIHESIIKSKERMNYEDVSNILENHDKELIKRYKNIVKDLEIMAELAKILKQKRDDRGCIDFEFKEAKIIMNDDNEVEEVRKTERRISNRMIEEFMILTNETIAENMYWSKVPFIYRTHEEPDEEKVEEFNKFIYNFGYTLKGVKNIHPKELQRLVEKVKGKKEETVINTLMLRSLKKAVYSNHPDGHFGLASDYYSHFTSPIRRYPDLQIHSIVKDFINNRLDYKNVDSQNSKLEEIAQYSSQTERNAEKAEREDWDYNVARYMSSKVGEEFEGVISSVTSFGAFVELDNTIEGLVHISNMTDDYYNFDEKHLTLIGERTNKQIKIGEIVKVKLANVNLMKRDIDFVFVD